MPIEIESNNYSILCPYCLEMEFHAIWIDLHLIRNVFISFSCPF